MEKKELQESGGNITFAKMVFQVQSTVKQLVGMMYPWIKSFPVEWPTVIAVVKDYKPKLYYCSVKSRFPEGDRVKCNTDGAS